MRYWILVVGVALFAAALLGGCAATRSPLEGPFSGQVQTERPSESVSLLLTFKHRHQMHGYDTIPKLKWRGISGFDDLMRDAMGEFSNISEFTTFTHLPTDLNEPKRRKELAALTQSFDYTLEMDFLSETSFAKRAFFGLVSTATLTFIPLPYSTDYTITATLRDLSGREVRTYERSASVTSWVQVLLLAVYPFHPPEGKLESLYSEALHDIFREIESRGDLRHPG